MKPNALSAPPSAGTGMRPWPESARGMRIAALADDLEELDLVRRTLQTARHDCQVFTEDLALRHELRRQSFDLLVLSGRVSGTGSGIGNWVDDHLKGHVPVLFLVDGAREPGVVERLSSKGNDFMVKPIRAGELAVRARALFQRARGRAEPETNVWGCYRFVLASQSVQRDGETVSLRPKEFELALALFRNMGRLVSRQSLLETVWRRNNPSGRGLNSRSLDVHVSRVRSALRLRPENGYRLASIYGHGYRLDLVGPEKASGPSPVGEKEGPCAASMCGITEHKTAWLVRIERNSQRFSRKFSFIRLGGRDAALAFAQAWRDHLSSADARPGEPAIVPGPGDAGRQRREIGAGLARDESVDRQ